MANIAIGHDVRLHQGKPVLVHTGQQGSIPLVKTMYVVGWDDCDETVTVAYPRPSRERSIVVRRSQVFDLPPDLTTDQVLLRPLQSAR